MLTCRFSTLLLLAISSVISARATGYRPRDFHDDKDLEIFVSRPDIRPPKFIVNQRHSHESASPGYLFVAPYADLRFRLPSSIHTPGQTGPHIYDSEGNLVWSGAHLFGHRPTFDFKASLCNGLPCLTFILREDMSTETYTSGAGVVLDTSFKIRDTISTTGGRGTMNMHEFSVTDEGTAMYITYSSKMTAFGGTSGFLGDNGFREVDIHSGKLIFEWWALDHVDATESLVSRPQMPGSYSASWDFFHMNSIDKNADGDYLISSRYLNSIFKISGKDGSIMWQLGGRKNSFKLQDFNFSSQHHARFIEEGPLYAVISFLNNAADDRTSTARQSSAMYVYLDLDNMTARISKQFDRPDQGLTRLRGNVQTLPNNNSFVSWSENALVSEFDAQGNCLFEGQFASHRFVTYRAYKFNFIATPSEPPSLVAQIYASAPNVSVTALYVSWNGATEVASWRFHGAEEGQERMVHLGEVKRTGFETALTVSGRQERVYVEALAADGTLLSESSLVRAITQPGTSRAAATHQKPEASQGSKSDAVLEETELRSGPSGSSSSAEEALSFERLAMNGLWDSPVTRLIIFLTSSCVVLCLALGFALYRIRRLMALGSSDCLYAAVKSVSLE